MFSFKFVAYASAVKSRAGRLYFSVGISDSKLAIWESSEDGIIFPSEVKEPKTGQLLPMINF